MIDPSTSSTIECTIDCGCTTTSIRSGADVEQPARLDHLEPLVHQRRRVDRDLRPHPPGRVPERVVRRDRRAASSAGRSRNGPPDAVRISRRTSPRSRPCRHWWIALCSLSTGSTATPCRRAASITTAPAITRISLFASAIVLPAVDRGEHGVERRRARRGEQHDVRVGMRRDGDQPFGAAGRRRARAPPAPRQLGARPSSASGVAIAIASGANARDLFGEPRDVLPGRERRRPAADRDARRRPRARSGRSSRSSRGWRSRFMRSGNLQVPDEDVVDGRGEQPAVDAIEHAAVAGNQRRRVLHAGAALEQRLEQIADDAERGDASRRPARASATPVAGNTQRPPSDSAAVPKTSPPIAPSSVFFGLIDGASGRRPKARPV